MCEHRVLVGMHVTRLGLARKPPRVAIAIIRFAIVDRFPVDPQLRHYLQQCSYDKALAWLEGA